LPCRDGPLSDHARQVLETLAAERLLGWRELATATSGTERLGDGAPELPTALLNGPVRWSRTDGSPTAPCAGHSRRTNRGRPSRLSNTVIDMASPLPIAPAGPVAACCVPSAGIDPALDAKRIAAVAKALGEPLRVQIVDVLRRSEQDICQCALITTFGVHQSRLAYHIKKLIDAGLVRGRLSRAGAQCRYGCAPHGQVLWQRRRRQANPPTAGDMRAGRGARRRERGC
jgi:ArsR family transcriptional regulator